MQNLTINEDDGACLSCNDRSCYIVKNKEDIAGVFLTERRLGLPDRCKREYCIEALGDYGQEKPPSCIRQLIVEKFPDEEML